MLRSGQSAIAWSSSTISRNVPSVGRSRRVVASLIYSQQNPHYLAQQPPPQKKRRRGCLVSASVVIVVVIAIVAIVSTNSGKGGTPTTSATSATKESRTEPAVTPTGANKVQQPVNLDNWTIIVNKVSTSKGSEFNQPQKPGDVFLLVDVSLKNNTGSSQTVSSLVLFSLKDASGQAYNGTFDTDAPDTPNGNLPAGQLLRGTIPYEVPATLHDFLFSFSPSLADWSLSV